MTHKAKEPTDVPIQVGKGPMLVEGHEGATGGIKHDSGKPRMELLAPEALFGTASVLTFGAAKYADRNWEKGMQWSRVFGALMRHLWLWWRGEDCDAESGLNHLHHAACCIMFLQAYDARKTGTDDRAGVISGDTIARADKP